MRRKKINLGLWGVLPGGTICRSRTLLMQPGSPMGPYSTCLSSAGPPPLTWDRTYSFPMAKINPNRINYATRSVKMPRPSLWAPCPFRVQCQPEPQSEHPAKFPRSLHVIKQRQCPTWHWAWQGATWYLRPGPLTKVSWEIWKTSCQNNLAASDALGLPKQVHSIGGLATYDYLTGNIEMCRPAAAQPYARVHDANLMVWMRMRFNLRVTPSRLQANLCQTLVLEDRLGSKRWPNGGLKVQLFNPFSWPIGHICVTWQSTALRSTRFRS